MTIGRVSIAIVAATLLASPLAAASDACAPMSHLVKLARNDFTALRSLRMQPGICTLRPTEYKCRWAFPGDAFAVADAQASGMVQCAAAAAAAEPQKMKRGETSFTLEPDLSLIVGAPEIDSGQWLVTLRIVAARGLAR